MAKGEEMGHKMAQRLVAAAKQQIGLTERGAERFEPPPPLSLFPRVEGMWVRTCPTEV